MECRPLQNNETEITENYIHRDKEDDQLEVRFLSRVEWEEYKKIQEVFLTFSNAKPINKSNLRKSLFNIAANLMRLLAILEDTQNQETTGCSPKIRANHGCDEYDKDQNIPKKINRHLGQKNDEYDQIPGVTIKRISRNNKPGYVAYTDKSLHDIDKSFHENDECRINEKKLDSASSQYIPLLQEYAAKMLPQKDEICDNQLNNETEIVFECKNVKSTITSFAPHKLDSLSQNPMQDSKISEATQAMIKVERSDIVKREYLDDNIEKYDIDNELYDSCEPNAKNEKMSLQKCLSAIKKSKKLKGCSKMIEKKSYLKVHKCTAHDRITHSSEICGKKFKQKHKLKIHTDVAHNRRKLYLCDTCGKAFARKNKLDRHINSVHDGITHACDSCGKIFKRKSSLKNHIDFVHKNLKHHKCDRCQKSFSNKTGLNLHMSTVHNGITYTCDLCEKIFKQKSYLRVHIDIVHMNNRKLFKCDECQKSFDYKSNLTSHIEYAHKGITHVCDSCKKVFRHKKDLKLHEDSVHNGITYPCDQCEKSFKRKTNLKLHMNEAHNGKK
ncbi:zinc finger protein 675-like [Trichogramma pretiosum]|uniref:zinc finger protein 675-like n=1 Tax=Trichogramma pretiosum TaxID=7493 RepID=UPI0006C97255|nr:zinc finger protein 675-like [Trichogramma pretiosum]XP_014227537.1 zinc finger protein 675-like [Trichogramma pretiosum]